MAPPTPYLYSFITQLFCPNFFLSCLPPASKMTNLSQLFSFLPTLHLTLPFPYLHNLIPLHTQLPTPYRPSPFTPGSLTVPSPFAPLLKYQLSLTHRPSLALPPSPIKFLSSFPSLLLSFQFPLTPGPLPDPLHIPTLSLHPAPSSQAFPFPPGLPSPCPSSPPLYIVVPPSFLSLLKPLHFSLPVRLSSPLPAFPTHRPFPLRSHFFRAGPI